MDRYLVQRGTGRFFIWTKALAKRKDMREVDNDTIQVRIRAMHNELSRVKSQLAAVSSSGAGSDVEAIRGGALALKEMQAKLDEAYDMLAKYMNGETSEQNEDQKDPDEIIEPDEEKARQNTLQELVENDEDIIKIRGMKSKKEVADYMAINFGVPVPEDLSKEKLEDLKNKAAIARTALIEEKFNEE